MYHVRSQVEVNSAASNRVTKPSTAAYITANRCVIRDPAALATYPSRLIATAARRRRIYSVGRPAFRARSPVADLLTVGITSAKRHAMMASVSHVKKIRLARSTVPAVIRLLRVSSVASAKPASSLCPFVTVSASDSCPAASISANRCVTMVHACDVRSLLTKAALATRARQNTLATR